MKGLLPEQQVDLLRQRLGDFFFFHLGSDAEWEVKETAAGFLVSVQHHRVEPFSFHWSYRQVIADLSRFESLEQRLLTLLNRHRR